MIIAIIYKPPKLNKTGLPLMAKVNSMDLEGTLVLISAIVCLLLALQWGGIVYPWTEARVWGCLFGFGCLLCVFVVLQFRRKEESVTPQLMVEPSFSADTECSAAIPLRILRQRSLACSCLFVALVNMAIDTHIYYLPFYFQAVKGTSAEGSGTRILPYLVSVFTTAIVAGSLITAFGYYVPLMWLGTAILTIGSGLIQTLQVGSTEAQWFGYQVLTGIGFGMAFQIPYTAAQVVLSAEDLPMGTALIVFFQALGGALAISIGQNVLSNALLQQLIQLPQVDAASVIADGATDIATSVPPALQGSVKAAYSFALSRTYILPVAGGGAAFLASLGMENRTVKKRQTEPSLSSR